MSAHVLHLWIMTVIRWRIQLCLSIALKLDSILNAWSLDSPSIYAGTRRRSTTSCPNYPVPALSLNRYVGFSSDKQDKSYKALQEAGGVVSMSLRGYESRSVPAPQPCMVSLCTSVPAGQVTLPVAGQVRTQRSATFLGRPWCHAVTATAFLRAQHVTLHLLASLSVILPGILTRMMQLLMTHIWLLHKCWFNMNEIWAVIVWEAWKLRASTT